MKPGRSRERVPTARRSPREPWSRRQLLSAAGGTGALAAGLPAGELGPIAAAARPPRSPAIKFLFLDCWTLDVVRGFQRRLNPPVKHPGNPILLPAKPWEGRRLHLYGTVLRDPEDGTFRMWYHSSAGADDDKWVLMYAVSRDGYAWERPDLDVVPWNGQRSNILMKGGVHGLSVMREAATSGIGGRRSGRPAPGSRAAVRGPTA